MLELAHARNRQKRLVEILNEHKLDAAVLGLSKHVYYLTTHLPFWQQYAGLVVFSDGRSVLIKAKSAEHPVAADSVQTYEATWNGTQRQEQPELVAAALMWALGLKPKRIGIDASTVTSMLAVATDATCVPIDADLWQMRRRKDPDELKLMQVAMDCCQKMYEKARQIIEPGVAELKVFSELHSTAVAVAGEPLSDYLGNDYACGAMGGPPRRDRTAQAGELYILDLGPAYRGYFSDNARTFSVDHKPTDAQLKAWEVVAGVHPIVEQMAKPGVKCRDIYATVDDYYRAASGRPFPHHLGHGVGLQPHEFPHLNPKWDDELIEGEIFTAEPGMYGDELGGGMRIENQYLVTESGVENLTPFPKELA
jgi:Xaa-Pro dipeptidase